MQGRTGDCCVHLGIDMNTYLTAGQRYGNYITDNSYDTNVATDTNPHIEVLTIDDLTPGLPVTSHVTHFIDGLSTTVNLRTGTGFTNDFSSANYTHAAEGLGGDFYTAEVLMYSRVLTTAEREAIQDYLGARYGITVP
jgi:hypothetical protein